MLFVVVEDGDKIQQNGKYYLKVTSVSSFFCTLLHNKASIGMCEV
jgi:hypothetical protein